MINSNDFRVLDNCLQRSTAENFFCTFCAQKDLVWSEYSFYAKIDPKTPINYQS